MRPACICDGYDHLSCDVVGAECALRQEDVADEQPEHEADDEDHEV